MYDYVARKFGKGCLVDDEHLDIMGKGDVHIKTINGFQWKLHDVKYVPSFKKNLISIDQLDIGYINIFGNCSWKIVKVAMVVAWGTKLGTLYITEVVEKQ